MADFSTLIATLRATIKTNYRQEITGQILQDDLLAIVDAVNRLKQDTLEGYAFHGAPLADGDSVSVTQNTFFLVAEGEYEINGSTIEVDAPGVSVIVYDSVNNTTNWYTLFAYDTTPTANSRNAITSGAVAAALAPLATKEDVEAVEQEVAQIAGEAGLAEAVIDTDGVGTEQEFTFRKSGGDGGAYYRKIKGKTLAWNQLVAIPSPGGSDTLVNPLVLAHKYYLRANVVQGANPGVIFLNIQGDASRIIIRSDTVSGLQRLIFTDDITNTYLFMSYSYANPGDDINQIGCTDLTLLYGSAIDGMSDAEILAKYEAEYGAGLYPFNPGTLISNDAEAVETTGVNQWDEEAEVVGSQLQSKNLIPVFPNTAYYITMLSYPSHYHNKLFYNAEGEEIGLDSSDAQSFITPADCAYMRFVLNSGYGTTYNNDICINLSNPAINGQYFPYWKRTLQLALTTKEDTDGNAPFADGMKGAGTAGDWCDEKGGEKRMDRVDLGDLSWSATIDSQGNTIFTTDNLASLIKSPATDVNVGNIICPLYSALSRDNEWGTSSDMVIAVNRVGHIFINNYSQSAASIDGNGHAAWLEGVMLDFELATPVPFTWAEPLNLGVKVDENGTERAVAPEGATAPSAPFVADTTYTMSVARMVEILKNL